MNQLEFQHNHLQMDYYSDSYQDFERDFYRYSNMHDKRMKKISLSDNDFS
ncbi:hypothetical protein Si131_01251 [Streptococcus infantarius subsp. infantarius]|nr:hypothetical protein [Streptococcus infantarius subsp. infantarius]